MAPKRASKAAKAAEAAGDAILAAEAAPPTPWFEKAPKPGILVTGREGPPRCGARSKRVPGKTCQSRPIAGGTRCRMHGGRASTRPNANSLVHGGSSQFVHRSEVEEIVARATELATAEGRKKATAARSAMIEARARGIPETQEFTDVWIKAQDSARKDIALLHEFDKKDTAPASAPVFQIANFGDASNGIVQGRTLEGAVTIQLVNGKPFILEERTGILYPAVLGKDEETGAEVYSRLILEG